MKALSPLSRSVIRATRTCLADVKLSRDYLQVGWLLTNRGENLVLPGTRQTKRPLRWAMVGDGAAIRSAYSPQRRLRDLSLIWSLEPSTSMRARPRLPVSTRLEPYRCYADWRALFAEEAKRPDAADRGGIDRNAQQYHYRSCQRLHWKAGCTLCVKSRCASRWPRPRIFSVSPRSETPTLFGVNLNYRDHKSSSMPQRDIAANSKYLVNLQFAHGFHNEGCSTSKPATRWRVDPELRAAFSIWRYRYTSALYFRGHPARPPLSLTVPGRASSRRVHRSKTTP